MAALTHSLLVPYGSYWSIGPRKEGILGKKWVSKLYYGGFRDFFVVLISFASLLGTNRLFLQANRASEAGSKRLVYVIASTLHVRVQYSYSNSNLLEKHYTSIG